MESEQSNPHGLNKEFNSKFQHVSPEKVWSVQQTKRCEYSNKDEENSLSNVNNYNTSFQKYRQIFICLFVLIFFASHIISIPV